MNALIPNLVACSVLLALPKSIASADFQPAEARVQDQTYWVGQRVPFFVELRAAGSFSGAASFSLPEIPRVVMIKIGNPVVSSEDMDGESVFVQTHEFALFSQQSGTVEIPSFEVRFRHRDGFTGPVQDQAAKVPATQVEIKRPTGSDENEFLVTTSSLKIAETWDPQPGSSTKQGAVFHRVITQEASHISGMALAPPPRTVPDGVTMYRNRPEVVDNTERGEFDGRRTDRITYVINEPGNWTVPGIKYIWWDPDKEQFGSKTLPPVTFQVALSTETSPPKQTKEANRSVLVWIAAVLLLMGIAYGLRRPIANWLEVFRHRWNPPDRAAARKLLRACRQNDPVAAEKAWRAWREIQALGVELQPELRAAVVNLQRTLFGTSTDHIWQGQQLEAAFRQQLAQTQTSKNHHRSALPMLNP